jgi:hypothetical protein
MSHYRLKTVYYVEGSYGSEEEKTLYCHHNLGCDITSFYDEDGEFLFAVHDTLEDNLADAINKLLIPFMKSGDLDYGIEHMNAEDRLKCGL